MMHFEIIKEAATILTGANQIEPYVLCMCCVVAFKGKKGELQNKETKSIVQYPSLRSQHHRRCTLPEMIITNAEDIDVAIDHISQPSRYSYYINSSNNSYSINSSNNSYRINSSNNIYYVNSSNNSYSMNKYLRTTIRHHGKGSTAVSNKDKVDTRRIRTLGLGVTL